MSRRRSLGRKVLGRAPRATALEKANRHARGARRDRPAGPLRRRWRRAREWARPVTRPFGRFVLACLAIAVVTSVVGLLRSHAVTVRVAGDRPVVTDVTQLSRIPVRRVLTPRTTDEVAAEVRGTTGPIAIGGGRYSMGGQTAVDGGVQVDMRKMNRILSIDTAARQITVQAGTRWRQIQEAIDTLGLAVKIMQTYSNFTVGGSMSVNSHGRYVGQGPLVLSVRSFRMVLADGSVVEARGERPEARSRSCLALYQDRCHR